MTMNPSHIIRRTALFVLLSFCAVWTSSLAAAFPVYQQLVVPSQGAYTGAYCDFGEGEDNVTYDELDNFQRLTGKPMAIVAFGSFWGRGTFPKEQVKLVRSYGAVPLLFWSPWDYPFDEKHGPDKFALTEIIAGKWDAYIDQWADEAAKVPSQFFVSFACEMNGTWFPWSGWFYGKGPCGSYCHADTDFYGYGLTKAENLCHRWSAIK